VIDSAPLVRHVSEIRKAHPEIPHYLALKCQLEGVMCKNKTRGVDRQTDRRHGSDTTRLSRVGRHRTLLPFTKHVHQALTSFYFIHEKCKNCSRRVYDMRTTLSAPWINLSCGTLYFVNRASRRNSC
jgi:hypothetical protein